MRARGKFASMAKGQSLYRAPGQRPWKRFVKVGPTSARRDDETIKLSPATIVDFVVVHHLQSPGSKADIVKGVKATRRAARALIKRAFGRKK